MSDTIVIRPMLDADLPGVLDTLRAALGETPLLRRSPELWRWKHVDNPFGPSIVLLAVAGDTVAGVRAFMRWELETPGGETLHCVRAVDTATHPEFQRQGIFRRLTEAAVDVARDDGVDMVFNTPNPMSGTGYRSMGWLEVGSIGVMVRPSLGLFRRGHSEAASVDAIDGGRSPLGLVPPARPTRGLRTPRHSRYLDWRFAAHPTARYARIDADGSAAVVRRNLRRGRRELLISDVFGPEPRRALTAARRHSMGGYAATWFSPGSPERRAAMWAGLLPVPGVTSLTLVARPLADLTLDVSDLGSWDLALSDLELL